MEFPFFTGRRTEPVSTEMLKTLPVSRFKEETNPENYTTDPSLANAASIAILMGKPLLLTGEPGTGKTQFAARLAWEMGNMPLLRFEAKSNSKATDLFYYFNMVGYFQSAQTQNPIAAKEFITYNALGEAILRTCDQAHYSDIMPNNFNPTQPQRAVVLIDEIDKAPRDFPNDILNELEGMFFRVPELENKLVVADPSLAPIVVITSNSERNLPETFLRRCIFHHIEFPNDPNRLMEIVVKRLGNIQLNENLIQKAVQFFIDLRDRIVLNKKPTIGELLLWLQALKGAEKEQLDFELSPELVLRTLGVLVKNKEDLETASNFVKTWKA